MRCRLCANTGWIYRIRTCSTVGYVADACPLCAHHAEMEYVSMYSSTQHPLEKVRFS